MKRRSRFVPSGKAAIPANGRSAIRVTRHSVSSRSSILQASALNGASISWTLPVGMCSTLYMRTC